MPLRSQIPNSHLQLSRVSKLSFGADPTIYSFVAHSPLIRTGLGHAHAPGNNGVNNARGGIRLRQSSAHAHNSPFLNSYGAGGPFSRRHFSSGAKVATMSASKDIATLSEEVRKVLSERFRDDAWYLIIVCFLNRLIIHGSCNLCAHARMGFMTNHTARPQHLLHAASPKNSVRSIHTSQSLSPAMLWTMKLRNESRLA